MCAQSETATCLNNDGGPPGPATVTIHVLDDQDRPAQGATVLFVSPDGAVLATRTSTAGEVSETVAPGTTATVVTTAGNTMGGVDTGMTTYMELWDGANITAQPLVERPVREVLLMFPQAPQMNTTAATTCGGASTGFLAAGSTDIKVHMPARCTRDFDAVAISPIGGAPQYAVGKRFSDVGPTFGSFEPGALVPTRVTHTPAAMAQSLAAYIRTEPTRGIFGPVSSTVPGESGTLATPGYEHFASYHASNSTAETVFAFESFGTVLYELDLDNFLMPWVRNLRASPESRRLEWDIGDLEGTTPGDVDIVVGSVFYFRSNGDTVNWRVIAPMHMVQQQGAALTLTLPSLGMQPYELVGSDVISRATLSTIGVSDDMAHTVVERYDPHANVFDYPGISPRIAVSTGAF
ncbi:hypothetical protein BH11MYX2_BH11MYX2_03820 [soil metagenome]